MRNFLSLSLFSIGFAVLSALPSTHSQSSSNISRRLFDSLEELARLVDISYCVGSSGIHKPFNCLSRCADFKGFELVTTWNTGPLLSDSCGYIALSHPPYPKRIIVTFRGTYSIANTVADLSSYPAEYTPFPSDGEDDVCASITEDNGGPDILPQVHRHQQRFSACNFTECKNCTVHSGFMKSWRNTKCIVTPHIEKALAKYPDYRVTLVGHSLGGAVAALASIEFKARGWDPQVTTFGEPRVGNRAMSEYIDKQFSLTRQDDARLLYRRVTHIGDPVPLLPLEEWGYRMHAGEIFISKPHLRPTPSDVHYCTGDEDPACIAGSNVAQLMQATNLGEQDQQYLQFGTQQSWKMPPRNRLWELFFAHRDYFWRLGLCVPGGDPSDWWRENYPRNI